MFACPGKRCSFHSMFCCWQVITILLRPTCLFLKTDTDMSALAEGYSDIWTVSDKVGNTWASDNTLPVRAAPTPIPAFRYLLKGLKTYLRHCMRRGFFKASLKLRYCLGLRFPMNLNCLNSQNDTEMSIKHSLNPTKCQQNSLSQDEL